ncbi:hypothetical protein F5148DRAFT_1178424 [Russula earlei]|uniref:Uncharacterized protein n=1 Tax=Russula earlei TaxID=71964 RepID=A0ACC0UG39_9AGAM|nr:hypothetical protein F5148DRAFT_1178424 [Russula earlei]
MLPLRLMLLQNCLILLRRGPSRLATSKKGDLDGSSIVSYHTSLHRRTLFGPMPGYPGGHRSPVEVFIRRREALTSPVTTLFRCCRGQMWRDTTQIHTWVSDTTSGSFPPARHIYDSTKKKQAAHAVPDSLAHSQDLGLGFHVLSTRTRVGCVDARLPTPNPNATPRHATPHHATYAASIRWNAGYSQSASLAPGRSFFEVEGARWARDCSSVPFLSFNSIPPLCLSRPAQHSSSS